MVFAELPPRPPEELSAEQAAEHLCPEHLAILRAAERTLDEHKVSPEAAKLRRIDKARRAGQPTNIDWHYDQRRPLPPMVDRELERFEAEEKAARAALCSELHRLLQEGDLIGFIAPETGNSAYVQIAPSVWAVQRFSGLKLSRMQGTQAKGRRVVFCRKTVLHPQQGKRSPGRPRYEHREQVLVEYARRREAAETRSSAMAAARSLHEWLRLEHPRKHLADIKTIAKWLREYDRANPDI